MLFLTKYTSLNPLWFIFLFGVPALVYAIYVNVRSVINKQFRTFAGTYPDQRLEGLDAQVAALILLFFLGVILVLLLLYFFNLVIFYKAIFFLFGRNNLFITSGVILILCFIYVYLIIFKNKNR